MCQQKKRKEKNLLKKRKEKLGKPLLIVFLSEMDGLKRAITTMEKELAQAVAGMKFEDAARYPNQ